MRRGIAILFIVIAAAGLGRFSSHVRNVDIAGLFASGAIAGVGLMTMFRGGK
jgi:hypothetical protein